jgi:two-component system response regulator PilR (NtrC family)
MRIEIERLRERFAAGLRALLSPGRAWPSGNDAAPTPNGNGDDLDAELDGVERAHIAAALEATRYNRTAAAARLGLTLRQLRYRMAKLGLG